MESNGSKRLVTIILIIAGVLALAGAGFAYYYFTYLKPQANETQEETTTSTNPCLCYWSTDSCGDPTNAVKSQIYSSCPSKCPEPDFTAQYCQLEGGKAVCEKTPLNTCKSSLSTSSDKSCVDLKIYDNDGNILAGPLDSGIPIVIRATYASTSANETFTDFKFIINGESVNADKTDTSGSGWLSEKEFEKIDKVGTLNIKALATSKDSTGKTIQNRTSLACDRSYQVTLTGGTSCSQVITTTSDTSKSPVSITALDLPISNLPALNTIDEVYVTFSFGGLQSANTLTTKNSVKDLISADTQKISFSSQYLTDSTNFEEGTTFPELMAYDGVEITDYTVSAKITYTTTESASNTFRCASDTISVVGNVDATPEEEEEDGETENNGEANDPNTNYSKFTITNTAPTCVERISPKNSAHIGINITNTDSETEQMRQIKNKLPKGFEYVANSTKINGVAQQDTSVLTKTVVGDSQELMLKQSTYWTLASGASMTIEFDTIVSGSAITGQNLNEVVIEPTNTPQDPASIRTSLNILVSQNCSAPATGIFDSTASKISLGVIALILSIVFYFTSTGAKISTLLNKLGITESLEGAVDDAKANVRLFGLKLTYPRSYFEEKVIRSKEKARKAKDR